MSCIDTPIEPFEPMLPAIIRLDTPDASDASDDALDAACIEPDNFFGEPDDDRLHALRNSAIQSVEKGKGGRSLGFKIVLTDGTKGYFKPKQSFSGARWFSEVAAYELDRELGFSRVAPVVVRRFPFRTLRQAAAGDKRLSELKVDSDGTVIGAFIWWIDEGVFPYRSLGQRWETWVRIDRAKRITPYQRPKDYRALLAGAPLDSVERGTLAMADASPSRPEQAAELSDLILFDVLISNVDRWGGHYTNVRRRGKKGPLVFFDNGAGFWRNPDMGLIETRLKALQKFRRSTIDAIRAFEAESFADRISDLDAQVLDEKQLKVVSRRQKMILDHVDELYDAHGDAIFAW